MPLYRRQKKLRRGAKSAKRYRRALRKSTELGVPRTLGGAPRIHYFTRMANDYIIGNAGVTGPAYPGGTQLYNTAGSAVPTPSYYNLGAPIGAAMVTSQFGFTMNFQLAAVAAMPEFARLFSRYKIIKVVTTVMPMYNTNDALKSAVNVGMLGTCTVAQDLTDDVPPNDENQLLETQGAKTYRLDKPFSFTVYPRLQTVAQDTAGNAVAAASMSKGNPWCDIITGNQLPHYGAKLWFNNVNLPNNGSNIGWKLRHKYYFACCDTD